MSEENNLIIHKIELTDAQLSGVKFALDMLATVLKYINAAAEYDVKNILQNIEDQTRNNHDK